MCGHAPFAFLRSQIATSNMDLRAGDLKIFTQLRILGALVAVIAWAVSSHPQQTDAPRQSGLIVYGRDFAFTVSEPEGWKGDTSAAERYGVNIVFFPIGQSSRAHDVTIRVNVISKENEDTKEDLKADRDEYREKYPNVQFAEPGGNAPALQGLRQTHVCKRVFL